MLPLVDKMARFFNTTDIEQINFLNNKALDQAVSVAEDLTKEDLDRLAFCKSAFQSCIETPSIIVSKALYDELKKTDFTPAITNPSNDPSYITDYNLTMPVYEDYKDIDKNKAKISQYHALIKGDKFKLLEFPEMVIEGDMVPAMPFFATFDLSEFCKIRYPEARMIAKVIHYIQHLGKPDLRKGTPLTTKKPKKRRQRFASDELFFDAYALTLGYGKDTKYTKGFWPQKSHLRLQPYGPRDNPSYRLIEIPATLKKRRKGLD